MGNCATGCLSALAAKGPQDTHLTCDPQITFWKCGYRRITNFSFCLGSQEASSAVGLGKKNTFKFDRAGDLVYRVYFRPEFVAVSASGPNVPGSASHYTNAVAYAAIETIDLEIGGTCFSQMPGEFMYAWDKLSSSNEKRLREMIGFSETEQGLIDYACVDRVYYAPLIHWSTRTPCMALPLIALQYHEVKVNMKLRAASQLVCNTGDYAPGALAPQTSNLQNPSSDILKSADLLIEYVYLDTMERRMMAQQQHEYLYIEEQFTGTDAHAAGQTSQAIRLAWNHPTLEHMWFMRRADVITPSAQDQLAGVCPNRWFDFSGVPDSYDGGVTFNVPTDPHSFAEIRINGHTLTDNFPAPLYRLVQPYHFHTNVPEEFIYLNSYALHPEDYEQPSGSLNLSRIDNYIIKFTFPTVVPCEGQASAQWDGEIFQCARNYNVLKIVSGMAGKMYAN